MSKLTLTLRTESAAGILPSLRSPGLPVSPTSSARENYTTSTPGISRHLISPRSTYDPLRSSYNYPETPRSMMSSASISSSPGYGQPVGLGVDRRANGTPPFLEQDTMHELVCNGQPLATNIEAKIEKGFFLSSDNSWTCYRRNYFTVQCSFTLTPFPSGRQIHLVKALDKRQHPVQAMAVSLSAAVDGATGKTIELVQHTPKRDKGPQSAVGLVRLVPTPPGNKYPHLTHAVPHGYPIDTFGQTSQAQPSPAPYLPLQDQDNSSASSSAQEDQTGYPGNINSPTAHQHTFERIQFKSATANNGKRRAQQQYYHLIVELYVDIRNVDDREPNWIKIAQRPSHAVVVRGRSPSHYSNEGPHSSRSSGGASGGGGGASGLGFGPMIRTGPGPPLGDSSGYRISMSQPSYRGGAYSLDTSPVSGGYHTSSATSISAPTIESMVESKPVMISSSTTDEAYKPLDHVDGYQYFPSPLYDAGLPQPTKSDSSGRTYDPTGRVKDEVAPAFPPGGVAGAWNVGRCGQFQGVSSSRGYYPSVDTGY